MSMNRIKVPYEFLEECGEKNCCEHLDMFEPSKSIGTVIEWKHRYWICFGSVHFMKYLEANLALVIPEEEYHGPPNDPTAGPELYYVGGRFRSRGKTWVITSKEVILIPISENRTKSKRRMQ